MHLHAKRYMFMTFLSWVCVSTKNHYFRIEVLDISLYEQVQFQLLAAMLRESKLQMMKLGIYNS